MNAPHRPIDFYFDFSSPYSYIASEWIEALAARHGRTVAWRAILLGATFQVTEIKSPVSYPLKREYTMLDFERSARFAGVPLKMPEKFPIATQNTARLFWWLNADDPERARDWGQRPAADDRALAGEGAVLMATPRHLRRRAPWGVRATWSGPALARCDLYN